MTDIIIKTINDGNGNHCHKIIDDSKHLWAIVSDATLDNLLSNLKSNNTIIKQQDANTIVATNVDNSILSNISQYIKTIIFLNHKGKVAILVPSNDGMKLYRELSFDEAHNLYNTLSNKGIEALIPSDTFNVYKYDNNILNALPIQHYSNTGDKTMQDIINASTDINIANVDIVSEDKTIQNAGTWGSVTNSKTKDNKKEKKEKKDKGDKKEILVELDNTKGLQAVVRLNDNEVIIINQQQGGNQMIDPNNLVGQHVKVDKRVASALVTMAMNYSIDDRAKIETGKGNVFYIDSDDSLFKEEFIDMLNHQDKIGMNTKQIGYQDKDIKPVGKYIFMGHVNGDVLSRAQIFNRDKTLASPRKIKELPLFILTQIGSDKNGNYYQLNDVGMQKGLEQSFEKFINTTHVSGNDNNYTLSQETDDTGKKYFLYKGNDKKEIQPTLFKQLLQKAHDAGAITNKINTNGLVKVTIVADEQLNKYFNEAFSTSNQTVDNGVEQQAPKIENSSVVFRNKSPLLSEAAKFSLD